MYELAVFDVEQQAENEASQSSQLFAMDHGKGEGAHTPVVVSLLWQLELVRQSIRIKESAHKRSPKNLFSDLPTSLTIY